MNKIPEHLYWNIINTANKVVTEQRNKKPPCWDVFQHLNSHDAESFMLETLGLWNQPSNAFFNDEQINKLKIWKETNT